MEYSYSVLISFKCFTYWTYICLENENSRNANVTNINYGVNCLTNSVIKHERILSQKTKKAMRSKSIAVNALNKMVKNIVIIFNSIQ